MREEQAEHAARALRAEEEAQAEIRTSAPAELQEQGQFSAAPMAAEPSIPAESAVPAETAPAAVAAEAVAPHEPVAAPAPVSSRAEAAPVTPVAEFAPAASVDVEKALQESGLVLIQTDPSKVKTPAPAVEPQFVPPRPPPRRAPPPDTGPLQIVETRKDA